MNRRARRAARWPRGAGWEFALREPSEEELEHARKARIERVIAQLTRRRHTKRPTPHETSRQQIRMELDGVRRVTDEVTVDREASE